MKILLINNCHYRRGGSEAVYFGTADLLKEMGHDVVFFSMEDAQNIHTDSPEYFAERGGRISQIRDYFCNLKAAHVLEYILNKEKPDIAHAHLLWGGIGPSIFAVLHKYGIPIVHTAHDYRMVCPAYTFRNKRGEVCEKCKGSRYYECVKGRCAKGSLLQSCIMAVEMRYRNNKWHPAKELDGIIYVSKFAKAKHEELDKRFINTKNIVLYNFSSVGEKYFSVEKDGGYYLYYGRLSHEKGISTLIDVFRQHRDLHLKVVGTGPLEKELKQRKSSNVEFLGYKSGEELYNIVRNARFVCVPSEWFENNPMTIVEAYSMGVPVIGANIGGVPEIIDEGNTGFLFESGNTYSLAKAITMSKVVGNHEYAAMKKSTLRFAHEHFDSEMYKEKLIGFYQDVISTFKERA